MAGYNRKVGAEFVSNPKGFLAGLSKINKGLSDLPKEATKATNGVNRRFDAMERAASKLDKEFGQLGDNVDMKEVNLALDKAQKEFKETGSVSKDTMSDLNKAIDNVDFNSLPKEAHSAFSNIKKDATVLEKHLQRLEDIDFLESLPQDAQKAGKQLLSLRDDVRKAEKALEGMDDGFDTKQINTALDKAQRELKETGTVSKETMRELDASIDNVDFNSLSSESKQAFNNIKNGVTGVKDQMRALENQRFLDKLPKEAKAAGQELVNLKNNVHKMKSQMENMDNSFDTNNITKELEQAQKELTETGFVSKKTMNSLNRSIDTVDFDELSDEAKVSFRNIEGNVESLKGEMRTLDRTVEQSRQKLSKIGEGMSGVGRNMTMYVSAPIAAGFGLATKKAADFEQQMSKVGAIAGSNKKELKALTDQAVDLGAKTSLSADEVASGMQELAALGFTTKDILKAMPGVISAAEASGADMATTATVMASSINAFGLEASESTHVADVLAEVANRSAADISDMGYALKYAGTPAKSLGASLEETAASIGIMTDSGLDGSQAGTTLRGALIRLAKPSEKASKQMEKLGINLEDSKGNFVGMPSLIGQFNDSMEGMSKTQKLANISSIVGTESASGFLALMEAGPNKISKFTKSLEESDGASKKAADQMKDNLKGSLEQLGGAFESLAIVVGGLLAPALRKLANFISYLVDKLTDMPKPLQYISVGFAGIAAAIGPVLLVVGTLLTWFVKLSATITALKGSTGLLGRVVTFLATKLSMLSSFLTLLSGPVGWVIAGIVALGVAFTVAYKKSETFRNIVNAALNGVKKAFMTVFNVVKGFFQLFQGNGQDGIITLSKILPPGVVQGLTRGVDAIKGVVMSMFNAVKNFAIEIGNTISAFWNKNGGTTSEAVGNIGKGFQFMWNLVKPILTALWTAAKWTFDQLIAVIKWAMPYIGMIMKAGWWVVTTLVKSAWENIKNIIRGALDIIMGIVRVFNGIFTGNWRMIWSGVKQIFAGALRMIWNLIQLWFVGKIFGLFKLGFSLIRGVVASSLGGIRAIFFRILNGIWSFTKTSFTRITSSAKGIFFGLVNFFRTTFALIRSIFTLAIKGLNTVTSFQFGTMIRVVKVLFNGLRRFFSVVWNGIKNATLKIISLLRTGAVQSFTTFRIAVIRIFSILRTATIKIWNSIKNGVIKIIRLWLALARNAFAAFRGWISRTFNAIRSFFVKVFSLIRTAVIKIIQNWIARMRSAFNGFRSWVTRTFNAIKSFFSGNFNQIRKNVVGIVSKWLARLRSMFTGFKNWISRTFNAIRKFLTNLWTSIRDRVVNLAKSLRSRVQSTFQNLYKNTRNLFDRLRNYLVGKWQNIRKTIQNIAGGMRDKVLGTFRKMRDGIKGVIGTIGTHIDGMVKKVKKGLNKLIDGVNWVGKKLGMDKIPKFKGLHTGTGAASVSTTPDGRLKQDTMAVVGDRGRGNGPGGYRNEIIEYPNGKRIITPNTDTQAYLPAGSKVYNGKQTHAAMQGQRLHTGTLPRFADGSGVDGFMGKTAGYLWGKKQQGEKKVEETVNNVKKKTAKTGKAIKDKIGDVMDFASKPGKLVDLVMKKFGVGFDLPGIPGQMMKAMYKKLKASIKDLFGGWLEDSGGGDGSSFTKYAVTTPYSPNKAVPGYGFNGGRHYGIDYATPAGTTIDAPTAGTVSKLHNHGGGTVAKLISGKFTQFFMHLQKILKTGKVKQGEKFAKTGNSGAWTTGPHLHYQVEKGHSADITNRNTMDPDKFLSGTGGNYGSGSKAARKIIKKAQGIMGGKFTSNYVTEQMMRLAKRESNFDVNAVNNWDSNAKAGNPSRGMFQMIKTTFDGYKTKGHNNYKNPVDQAVAVLNYINKKYTPHYGFNGAFKRSADRAYADGGFANFPQLAWLAEGGFSESIVSHDPANRIKSKAIHDRTGELLGFNEEPDLLRGIIDVLKDQYNVMKDTEANTRDSNTPVVIDVDGKRVSKHLAPHLDNELPKYRKRMRKE